MREPNAHAQTLSETSQNQLHAILNSPALEDAHTGLCILDLGTVKDAAAFPAKAPVGKPFRVLFEQDAGKKFMPASNMKLFTAALALNLLGPERTFPTRVISHGSAGTLVRLTGGGDPSLSVTDLADLAREVRPQLNIQFSNLAHPSAKDQFQTINQNADFTADGSAFDVKTSTGQYPFGWTLDDTLWYYGMEISALSINRNQIDIVIKGGEVAGKRATVEIKPAELGKFIQIDSDIETGEAGLSQKTFEDLVTFRFLAAPGVPTTLVINGHVAPNQILQEGLALPNPEYIASRLFVSDLGVVPTDFWYRLLPSADLSRVGRRLIPIDYFRDDKRQLTLPTPSRLVFQHDSPPLKTLFQRLLKNSDNLYAEMLLRDAAYYHDGEKNGTSQRAHELLKQWLVQQGIDTTPLRFEDGSGLSRYNLLTPRATAQLLAAINGMKEGSAIWNALPIAAIDGTLKNRMGNTPAANNARAKTGTFSIASNLSGYVTTKDGHRLAVSFFVNFSKDTKTAQAAQDKVFAVLAGATVNTEPAS